jgi:hypothetical protein
MEGTPPTIRSALVAGKKRTCSLGRRDVITRPFASSAATVGSFDRVFTAVRPILGNPGTTVERRLKDQRSYSRQK